MVTVFAIEFGEEAIEELERFRTIDRKRMLNAIEKRLRLEPLTEDRHRKILVGLVPPWEQVRPVWQLRVGDFLVFYDVAEKRELVVIRAVRRKGRRLTEEIL